MSRQFMSLCVLACALLLTHSVHAQEIVFLEQDGIVMMEMESVPIAKGWEQKTEFKGFTGEAYYKHIRNGGEMHYRFFITQPGTYHFRIHNKHDHADKTEENDCWVALNGGKRVKVFSYIRAKWNYIAMHEFSHTNKVHAKYDLPIGEHVITISGRSVNFMMDHLLLYKDGLKKAESKKHQESLPIGGVDFRKLKHSKKAEAEIIVKGVEAYAAKIKNAMMELKSSSPALATQYMTELGKQMKGSPAGEEIITLAKAWSKEPAVKEDKKAEDLLKKALVVDKELDKRLRGKPIKDDAEANRHARYIGPLLQISKRLDKSHASSRAKTACDAILEKHGVAHLKQ